MQTPAPTPCLGPSGSARIHDTVRELGTLGIDESEPLDASDEEGGPSPHEGSPTGYHHRRTSRSPVRSAPRRPESEGAPSRDTAFRHRRVSFSGTDDAPEVEATARSVDAPLSPTAPVHQGHTGGASPFEASMPPVEGQTPESGADRQMPGRDLPRPATFRPNPETSGRARGLHALEPNRSAIGRVARRPPGASDPTPRAGSAGPRASGTSSLDFFSTLSRNARVPPLRQQADARAVDRGVRSFLSREALRPPKEMPEAEEVVGRIFQRFADQGIPALRITRGAAMAKVFGFGEVGTDKNILKAIDERLKRIREPIANDGGVTSESPPPPRAGRGGSTGGRATTVLTWEPVII